MKITNTIQIYNNNNSNKNSPDYTLQLLKLNNVFNVSILSSSFI